MWLKNCWQVAAFAHEVGHEILARKFNDEAVVLFRQASGEVAALEDRCAHRFLPLSKGKVVDGTVQCGYHGMRYDGSGRCVKIPGQEQIPSKAFVRTYPVVERYKAVWIWMGDATLADSATVPDFHWMDDPEWAACQGYHHVEADYRLLNDNLLDLSHESFVHTETIGNAAVADSPLEVTVEGSVVSAYREMQDCPPPPFYVQAAGFTANIDRWHTTIYTPPGFHVIKNGSRPAGTTIEAARAQKLTRERRVMNMITPETATTAHYFWSIAREYAIEDAALTEYIRSETARTFDQDADILKAQQQALAADPEAAFPVALRADLGAIQGRRVLAAAVAREAADKRERAKV
jgi:phenylpropionate dioxygenase-like ring-hydroxylating dioxygenase large terminal subunit